VTCYTFFIEYGFNLRVKVNCLLTGIEDKKNDHRNDWDKNKNYLLGKEIHQQLLAAKVTIIQLSIDKENPAQTLV